MASKKEVKVSNSIYNVTNMIKEKNAVKYNSVQGYTVSTGANQIHFFTARPDGAGEDDVLVGHILGSYLTVSKNRGLGHGNDCAFYDSDYFIAQGGGTTNSIKIKRLNNSLSHVATYEYKAMDAGDNKLPSISCIAHLNSNYFVLGKGSKFAVCLLDEKNNQFVEKSRFHLKDSDMKSFTRPGCSRNGQGIYCTGNKLYKVYSYNNSSNIVQQNDIAVFTMPGTSPSFSGAASLNTIYSCDRTNKAFFEIESISSPDSGKTMFMLANVKESTGSNESDKIYNITLP